MFLLRKYITEQNNIGENNYQSRQYPVRQLRLSLISDNQRSFYIVTDLIKALLVNSSVSTFQSATIEAVSQ
jgi:hypothetical protein